MLDDFILLDTFTTQEGTVNIYNNGLVESVINEGAYVDVDYLRRGKIRIEEVMKGKKVYVLNESLGHFLISRDARQLSASREYSSHIAATAVIINSSAVKLLMELYLSIDKPHTPTKAFTKKEEAVRWLLENMKVAL
jgi:hypothetical protein